jgi:butyrate kinase
MNSELMILVINPRVGFTKVGLYCNTKLLFLKRIHHAEEDRSKFNRIADQTDYRVKSVFQEIEQNDIDPEAINLVIGRGGLIKPVKSGVYSVNEAMVNDLKFSPFGEDVVNLGGLIAYELVKYLPNASALIADPVVVDELDPIARVSGHPLFERKSVFHALSQKWVARKYANSLMKPYESLNLIVAHLGSGITVGAHSQGRVIDVNQGFDGEGPIAPVRSGSLPVGDIVRLCFSGKYTKDQILKMITGEGGLCAYFGTNSAQEVEEMALQGDEKAKLIFEAMAYQVAKHIGAMFTVLRGKVDAILISGGIGYSKYFTDLLIERVKDVAPVHVFPGADEIEALAMNGLRALKGEAEILEYI